MENYCVICKKNTENENSSVTKTKQNKLMLLSKCVDCGKEKSIFFKNKRFQMISLKRIKSLTNFYCLEKNLCQNCV